jgi:hypothetical protein
MLGYIVNYIISIFNTKEADEIQMDSINTDLTQSCIINPTLTPNVMTPLPRNKFNKN